MHMRRVGAVRSSRRFTSLKLHAVAVAVVPVLNTIYPCASSVRNLSSSSPISSLSLSSGIGFGPGSRNRSRNWTALVKGNYIVWNTHNRVPFPQFSQSRSAKMSTSSADVKEVVDKAGEPASKQAEILGENPGREEDALPKLSAADFKLYNSMAERMNYFVRLLVRSSFQFPFFTNLPLSTTTSDKPGHFSKPLLSITNDRAISLCANFSKPDFPSSPTSKPITASKNNTYSPFSRARCQNSRRAKMRPSCCASIGKSTRGWMSCRNI